MADFLRIVLYQPLFNALMFLVWVTPNHNVGIAIIALTIITRLLLLPPSLKAARAQLGLKKIQPQIEELRKKYKDDKKKQAEATMELYRLHKVNPLGSCLPLLIQFPILIALYRVFINGLSMKQFGLLYAFVPHPSSVNTIFLGINLARPERYVLPIVSGVLQFVQARQLQPKRTAAQKNDVTAAFSMQFTYLMPVFTVLIAGQLPAALPLYWTITTLFGIIQQWWVARSYQEEVTVAVREKKHAK